MYIFAALVVFIFIALSLFLRQPKFGRLPSGDRRKRIQASPHYKNGSFQNQEITPDLTEGASFFSVLMEYFFRQNKRVRPADRMPAIKTDLLQLDPHADVLVWFGHSAYFIQLDGKRILVDPVFSGSASPVSFSTRAFPGTTIYKPEDMPEIDFLFISHDHWDHMDYDSLRKLRPRVKKLICGLGTGEHLERWGYPANRILEQDWYDRIDLGDGFVVDLAPGRHFSGRGFRRNQALWTAFVLQTPSFRIFLGGDSGYGHHFAEIGSRFGPFDLAVLENGQYDKSWKYIHMMPEQVMQAATDLRAKKLLPVHAGKFAIANHAWDEPFQRIRALGETGAVPVLTPRIGEMVRLKDPGQVFTAWWTGIN